MRVGETIELMNGNEVSHKMVVTECETDKGLIGDGQGDCYHAIGQTDEGKWFETFSTYVRWEPGGRCWTKTWGIYYPPKIKEIKPADVRAAAVLLDGDKPKPREVDDGDET